MMGDMLILVMIVAVMLALVAAGVTFVFATRRAEQSIAEREANRNETAESVQAAVDAAVGRAVADTRQQASAERDAAVQAALEQAALLQREQFQASIERQTEQLASTTTQVKAHLDAASTQMKEQTSADLGAKKDVIDARLDQVHAEMRSELSKVTEMLTALGQTSAQKFGEVESSLRAHMEIANTLSESTQALRSALANPQARGQWGERMAEDVLRLAGFVENVNYVKQTQIDGGTGRPDFTFPLPKGHELYMDVKFPLAGYLRYLDGSLRNSFDLAGVREDEVEIVIECRRVTVRGSRPIPRRESSVPAGAASQILLMEIENGSFVRVVDLPRPIDPRSSVARQDSGFLWLHLSLAATDDES